MPSAAAQPAVAAAAAPARFPAALGPGYLGAGTWVNPAGICG